MFSTQTISRVTRIVLVVLFCSLVLIIPSPGQTVHASVDHQDGLQIFTRDVFVIVGSSLRTPGDTTAPGAPLFSNSGVALNLTWGQWQAASAASTAQFVGGLKNPRTEVRIHLTGLIPHGVYSIFYITLGPDSQNPLCPGVERGLPLTGVKPERQKPDASSFVANGRGAADYRGQVNGNLLGATQLIFEVIYHFDGQVYNPLPNHGEFLTQGSNCRSSFGEDAMRQLLILQKY